MNPLPQYGAQSMVAPLRQVLLVPPNSATDSIIATDCGWTAFAPQNLRVQFDAFSQILSNAGVAIHLGTPAPLDNPDAIYAYDPVLLTARGWIALRPGKRNRRQEPLDRAHELNQLGIPCCGHISPPGKAEAGDMLWVREDLLWIGLGWRTNLEAVAQLRSLLPDVTLETFDLPNHCGKGACLHLMSLLSLLSPHRAVVYPPLLPVRLLRRLHQLEIDLIPVPEAEFATLGTNVLALDHQNAIALEHNPITNALIRASGTHLHTFSAPDLCLAGTGGPTCLSRPLWRA